MPDLVPLLHLPGRVPAKGDRFSGAAPAGPMRRLRPRVLLGLQGQLAPWAGLPREQPARRLLPPRREQVLLLTLFYFFCLISYELPVNYKGETFLGGPGDPPLYPS